jgi:hypothetical protein
VSKLRPLSKPDALDVMYRMGHGEFSVEADLRHEQKLKRIIAFKNAPKDIWLKKIFERKPYELERVLTRI